MKRLNTTLLSAALAATCSAAAPGPSKPNILINYADDLHYGEVSCYNPERCRTNSREPSPIFPNKALDR